MEEFKIIYTLYFDGKKHLKRFTVQVIYQSNQVERYRLYAGQKEMILEKRLAIKRFPWKVLSVNFQLNEVDGKTVDTLNQIWKLIDEKMQNKPQSNYRPPEERNSHW